jgi:DNA-binding NarL/FixJ family response regulator
MRVARPIVLTAESRRELEQQARGRSVPMRAAVRSRIVLLAADGKQHKQISEELKISPRMAALWRGRFLLRGVAKSPDGA